MREEYSATSEKRLGGFADYKKLQCYCLTKLDECRDGGIIFPMEHLPTMIV